MKIPSSCDKPFIFIKKHKQIVLPMNGQEIFKRIITVKNAEATTRGVL